MASRDQLLFSAREQLAMLVKRLGEDDFAMLVEELSLGKVRLAIAMLHSSEWWQRRLEEAITNPAADYNTTLLCKLIDKAVATPHAVKVGAEEGFRLVIEQEVVGLPPSSEKDDEEASEEDGGEEASEDGGEEGSKEASEEDDEEDGEEASEEASKEEEQAEKRPEEPLVEEKSDEKAKKRRKRTLE